MDNNIPIKIYNKDGKIKLSVKYSKVTKTISTYKYNGESVDTHHLTVDVREAMDKLLLEYSESNYNPARLSRKSPLSPYHAYYEMTSEVGGVLKKRVSVSKKSIEKIEIAGDMEEVRTTINLDSKNEYEKRIKYFEGERYESEFKNGELYDIAFRLKENKINEYLKTLQDGKEKN